MNPHRADHDPSLRTFNGLEKEANRQAAIARIGQIVGSELEIEPVFDEVADAFSELIEFNVVMVTIPTSSGSMMRNILAVGEVADSYTAAGPYDSKDSLAERSIKARHPIREDVTP